MTREERKKAIEVLDDMKVKIDIPKAAKTQNDRNWALDVAIQALSQEPCDDVVSRQAVKVWLEEMDNKLNPRKYNTIAEYYAVKAQMQKLIYICDIPKEKSCLNCKYNNENLYRGEHCGDCDECMLWEQEEQLPSVTQKCEKCAMNGSGSKYCDNCRQKSGKWIITPFSVTGRHYQCSECRYIHTFTNFEFCPNCGAKMVEPQESEEV